MGNINSTFYVLNGAEVPGPRLNPKLYDKEKLV